MLAVRQEEGWDRNPMLNVNREVPPITSAIGLVDNCSRAFPKIAQHAAGLLSILICTNPASAFSCLNGKMFVESVNKYFEEVWRLNTSECLVEQYFGVTTYLNILPALFHFGMWNEAKSSRIFNHMIASFVSFTVNMSQYATSAIPKNDDVDTASLDQIYDPPRDLDEFPEMISANVYWESLLLVKDEMQDSSSPNRNLPRDWRVQLLHQRPRTFAVVAGIEVLGWWSAKGIDFSSVEIRSGDSDTESISNVLRTFASSRIRLMIRGSPWDEQLSPYINRIMDSIMNGTKAKKPPHRVSLLYGPFFYDSRRCGFCQKTEQEVGHDLLSCLGGCCGLEQYCCKEHQKSDWKKHKFWCKRNGKYSQHAG